MKIALVTIVIGNKYEDWFNEFSYRNWKLYCEKFNFELMIIKEPLDSSERAIKRSVAWQKLLILSQPWSANYDRIIWLDADIIINTNEATDVTQNVPLDKVGAVEALSIPSNEFHDIGMKRLYTEWTEKKIPFLDNTTAGKYYTNRGIAGGDLKFLMQTGVFVCSPKYHKTIFEKVYNEYEDTMGGEWNYEMPAFSYELVKADILVWISPRFNFIASVALEAFYYGFIDNSRHPAINFLSRVTNKLFRKPIPHKQDPLELKILKNIYDLSMFMHFAGCSYLIPKMKNIVK